MEKDEIFDVIIEKLTKDWHQDLRERCLGDYAEMKEAGTALRNILIASLEDENAISEIEKEIKKRTV